MDFSSLFNDVTTRHMLKIIVAVSGFFLVYFYYLYKNNKLNGAEKVLFNLALVIATLASIGAYFEFGWLRYDQYMNPHDVYHYHMGAKYSEEHSYYDLYRATLVADAELGQKYQSSSIRNLNDHRFESVAAVLTKGSEIKSSFTESRWEAFKKDTLYWRNAMPQYKWDAVLRDKGYNATPVWNGLARFITERVDTNNIWHMRMLTYLDLVLLVAVFLALWYTFGWQVMLFAILFHGVNFFMGFVHIKGAFLRLDWLCATILAFCLLEKRHLKWAGIFMAYAAMVRVFPVIFCFGLGAKFLWRLYDGVRTRWQDVETKMACKQLTGFFVAFAVTCVALGVGSLVNDGDTALWSNFTEKIALHNQDISTNRAGFKYVFVGGIDDKKNYYEENQWIWRGILMFVLALTFLCARRLNYAEALALGFVPMFFVTAPTFYYFVCLLLPLLFFLTRCEEGPRAIGASLFFLITASGYALSFWLNHHFELFRILSTELLALCIYMGFVVLGLRSPELATQESDGSLLAVDRPSRPTSRIRYLTMAVAGILLALAIGAGAGQLWKQYGRAMISGSNIADTEGEIELVLVGDVMLSRNVARSIERNSRDFRFPFELTERYINGADLAFCNLESPISGRGEPIDKRYLFNAPAHAIDGLQYAGFDVISLANNHILDFGVTAMDDSERIVAEHGMHPIGIVEDKAPQKPAILEKNGVRVGFLAYCDPESKYGYAREFFSFSKRPAEGDQSTLARDIAALKERVDVIVVSMHWGIEYQFEPNAHQQALGRFIIDQGADIVAGHHQHVQQEPEVYRHGVILHGMGNFVFDQHSRPPTREGRLYRVRVDSDGIQHGEYLPLEIVKDLWQPTPKQANFVSFLPD